MIIIKEYIDSKNQSPYARWFNRLNAAAAARVATTLIRMEHGNLSNTKRLGGGVLESRIDFGPGYRIYFGRDGDSIVILLGGGTKKRQSNDIEKSKALCKEYKNLKRQEG
jgi:putative addiction module killer protein